MTGIPGWQGGMRCWPTRAGSRRWAAAAASAVDDVDDRAPRTPRSGRRGAVIAPVERARTLPAAAYLDPEVFAWERRWFFDHGWVCLGRTADMPAPGDQRAVTVGTSGVLLVRDRAGGLGAFANACRHRGHELLPCGADTTNRGTILCPYHGWAYDLDGSLRNTPRFGDHESFARRGRPRAAAERGARRSGPS